MRGINSQAIILKTKISQLLKKGNLTEIFAVNSKSNNKHGRDMDVNQDQCSNKNGLILTISFQKEFNPMQQEIQYVKNKVKNHFEENMKLRFQIEGITQEMKSRNNHTSTACNKTNEIKKSLETLTKIHQEHSDTSNKDIINIENDIRNIDKELAKKERKLVNK